MGFMRIEQLGHTTTAIAVRAVRKLYGNEPAVRGVDLAVAPGETVALLGPNGAGKSTTIDMILGLTPPDAGTVSVFGVPPNVAVRHGWVGGMLQTGSPLDHLKVRELVRLMASYYPRPLDIDDVLDQTGIAELADQWTDRLSGGQAQRVRFATALVGNPDLLILDEPTAAMDVEGRRQFWAAMRGVAAQGKTVIFATHYLEEADAYADRIVLMAHGRIVADGPATEIKAQVGRRTVRATLPGVDLALLRALPGVLSAERHGDSVTLSCSDADAATGALFSAFPDVRDLEVHGSSLEDAFFELTVDRHDDDDRDNDIDHDHTNHEVLR